MVEEVYRNIYRIGVVLPGNPLRELNSYFIRGEQSDLLIDTGFRRPACRNLARIRHGEMSSLLICILITAEWQIYLPVLTAGSI